MQMAEKTILLDHGSGGKLSHLMFSDIILPLFDNRELAKQDDGAVIDLESLMGSGPGKGKTAGRLAFSTDSYVVDPIFFPGGNIGDLAVNGTVNDISMCGAVPFFISAALIIEEGFLFDDLQIVIKTMADAAKKAGVKIVTGDTKVVPRGKADKIFINTSGMGIIPDGVNVSGSLARPGDSIIVSGTIADHGIAILSTREGLKFDSGIKSDSAPLNQMVKKIVSSGADIHVLRDPTRGGLGTTLNEIAGRSDIGIEIDETSLPVSPAVQATCDLLGFDPLYIANEGKLVVFVSSKDADRVLEEIRKDPYGKNAQIIGRVTAQNRQKVFLKTAIGGSRPVDMLTGDQLPRIC